MRDCLLCRAFEHYSKPDYRFTREMETRKWKCPICGEVHPIIHWIKEEGRDDYKD